MLDGDYVVYSICCSGVLLERSFGHDNMAFSGERSALSGLSDLRKEKAEEKENLWWVAEVPWEDLRCYKGRNKGWRGGEEVM